MSDYLVDKMLEELQAASSSCCERTVSTSGDVTRYYVCDECGEQCDLLPLAAEHDTKEEPDFEGLIQDKEDYDDYKGRNQDVWSNI